MADRLVSGRGSLIPAGLTSAIPGDEADSLKLLDKDEMWDVLRSLQPDLTRSEFDRKWDELMAEKAARRLN
jgi:hypothetical protein